MHVELPLSLDDPKSLLPYEMIGMQYAIALTCFILWWKETGPGICKQCFEQN